MSTLDCTPHQVRGIPTAPGAAAVRGLRFPQEDDDPNMGASPVPNMVRGLRLPQEDGEPQPPESDQPQPVVTEGWRSEVARPSASSTEVREPTTGAVTGAGVGAEVGAVAGAMAGALPGPRDHEDEELAVGQAVGQAVSPRSLNDWRSSKAAREETQGSPLQYVGAHRGRSPR